MENTQVEFEQPVTVDGTEVVEETVAVPEVEAETVVEADAEVTGDAEPMEVTDADRSAELARLIAEAEERGYKRGRNESIARLMERPAQVDPELNDVPAGGEPEVLILANIRPSVWD